MAKFTAYIGKKYKSRIKNMVITDVANVIIVKENGETFSFLPYNAMNLQIHEEK